jgi:hypothetical protein
MNYKNMLMKKIFFAVVTLLLLMQVVVAQVNVQSNIPPVGMIQKNQLWNMLVINNSKTTYDCRMELVLRDRLTGQDVLTATSGTFTLTPGAKQLNATALNPIQYNYLVQGFDNRLQGLIPVGVYMACFALTSTTTKDVNLAEECIPFDAEPLSPPMLIFPADSSVLENAPAQFSWTPPAPIGMFDHLSYEILITEIKPGQKAAEAIQENLPLYSDGYVTSNSTGYPASASKIENDKWYAWQVVAKDDKNYAAKTETWVFTVAESRVTKIIKGTPFVKLKSDAPDMAIAPNGYLKIAYDNRGNDSLVKVEVTEMSGDKKSGKQPSFTAAVRPGENLIEYNLKKIMAIAEDKTYQAVLTNRSGEKWSVLFRIKIFKD